MQTLRIPFRLLLQGIRTVRCRARDEGEGQADIVHASFNVWIQVMEPTSSSIERAQRLGRRQFDDGEDIFAVQWSGIHKMAQTGDIRGLRFFLEDGNTPPDIRDDRGDTPLNIAAYSGQPAAVEELLRQGADFNAKNNKGWTPALSAASANHREVMMLLHRSGADLKMKDMTGSTVAHMAASTNSVQSLKAIYDCFGDPGVLSTQANNGSTPAHIAAIFDNAEALQTLHELGANIDKRDRMGETPAHKAARSHHVRTLEFLQAVGADMNVTNDEDDTPRHLALWSGRFER